MDFGRILRRAFDYTFKYKSLWVLGFFSTFFGNTYGFIDRENQTNAAGILFGNPTLLIFLIIYAMTLFFLFIVMHLISTAGLIDAIAGLEDGRKYELKNSFKVGTDTFWRFLGLWLLLIATVLAVAVILAVPIVVAFILSTLLGILFLIALIPAALAAYFVIDMIYLFAQREIVIRRQKIGDAVVTGYFLLKNNLPGNVIAFFIISGIGLVMFALSSLLVLIFALPLIMAGTTQAAAIVFIMLFIEVPIFIAVAILITGSFGTFQNSILTIYYLKIRALSAPAAAPLPGRDPRAL
ncbi:membrane hypothetical protein [Candidatus Zixiibacteriota bacterium]|nr:membrane hypothetical protein [candidate division Zixibacteria bacterium]